MANITAAMVKELREITGAGMMDCKKALTETNGDMQEAVNWLRTKGLAAAAKKSSRTAAEGLIAVCVEGTKGAIIEVNAETDFVGRNELFQTFAKEVAKIALHNDADLDKTLTSAYPGTGRDVSAELTHLVATIGENMMIRRASMISVNDGVVADYIHNQVAPNVGKIGVLVALESKGDKKKLAELAKQIAMHIAATGPQSNKVDDLDQKLVDTERRVFTEQARESGKSDDVIAKMIDGRIRKYYEQVILHEQTFVMDGDRKISQVVSDAAKDVGADVALVGFICYKLGEGIEKEEKDFAAEVAAQLTV